MWGPYLELNSNKQIIKKLMTFMGNWNLNIYWIFSIKNLLIFRCNDDIIWS